MAAAQAAIAARRAADHALHAAVARLDTEGAAAAGGYRSTAALLRDALRVDPGESRHLVDHWLDGGATELANLTLLCLVHHQLVHHGGWNVKIVDGRPWWWPPTWIDPQRTPRPGGRFPVPDQTPAP